MYPGGLWEVLQIETLTITTHYPVHISSFGSSVSVVPRGLSGIPDINKVLCCDFQRPPFKHLWARGIRLLLSPPPWSGPSLIVRSKPSSWCYFMTSMLLMAPAPIQRPHDACWVSATVETTVPRLWPRRLSTTEAFQCLGLLRRLYRALWSPAAGFLRHERVG